MSGRVGGETGLQGRRYEMPFLAKTNNWHRIPLCGERVVKFWPLATLGLRMTPLLPSTFCLCLGPFPFDPISFFEIKSGPLTVGVLRGFETTR